MAISAANSEIYDDMTILHIAIKLNRQDLVDLIISNSNNIDLDIESYTHGTPLHEACRNGNIKIVQKLVLSNANIFIRDSKCKLAKECTNN